MRFEFRHRRADDSIRDVEVFSNKIELMGQARLYSIVHDITERKRAEEGRVRLERRLQYAQKAESLAGMAGAIAHLFNNKLMVIMGNLDLASLNDPEPNQGLSSLLSKARDATSDAAEVIDLMLAYIGQTVASREALDLASVCHEVVGIQTAAIPRRMSLKADIRHYGLTIKANRDQILLVLTNLLTNVVEAIGEGQGDILVSVRTFQASDIVSSHLFPADWKPQSDVYACLEVSDTGSGIDPDKLDQIFDPFFSTKLTGRGLGLAVVLGTVRAHGGAVSVESEPGRGSTFRVFWPLEVQKGEPLFPEARAEVAQPIQGEGSVLVVDDDYQVRMLVQAMLSRMGYQVTTASDGFEAVRIFRERRDEIRLVLLDLTMPGMNGWQTLAALRELRPDIPVILASGYDEAQVMQGDHPELPQIFLHKPYTMKDLKAALGQAGKASPASEEGDQHPPSNRE